MGADIYNKCFGDITATPVYQTQLQLLPIYFDSLPSSIDSSYVQQLQLPTNEQTQSQLDSASGDVVRGQGRWVRCDKVVNVCPRDACG